jgi:hypothetical protein
MTMTKPPLAVPNTLNLSQQDFDNLVAVIADSLNGSKNHPNHFGPRFVMIPKSEKGLPDKKLDLPIPAALEALPDSDPRVISWVMSQIMFSAYKPEIYRKQANELLTNQETGTTLTFKSHVHKKA